MQNRNFTPFPILTTERLTLRQLDMTDEQEIFTLRSDRDINKYLGRPACTSMEEARSFITKINDNITKNAALYRAITLKDKKELVGTICLFGFTEDNDKCEIGYELLTPFQGQGIMKEAAEKVIDYVFNMLKVQKIEAFFHKDNLDSVKLLDKLSFHNSNEMDEENPELIGYYLMNPKA